MSQLVTTDNKRPYASQQPPRVIRLMLLSMITICGVLMIGIVLSNPMVTSKFTFDAEHVSSQNERPGNYGGAVPVLSVGPAEDSKRTSAYSSTESTIAHQLQLRTSGHLPGDRVPVRRGGIVSGN